MRELKTQQLYDFITQHKNLCLLKGPPGSGKSFFSALFRIYLHKIKLIPKSQIFEIIAMSNWTYNDLQLRFYKETKFDLGEVSKLEKLDYFFIIDEAHQLYNNEIFQNFWSLVKNCSERKLNIHFLFCAVYSQTSLEINEASPLILRDKYLSLEFLQFDENEFSNLIAAYHKWSPRAEHIMISEIQTKLLFDLLRGHPEISQMTIKTNHNFMA